MADFQALLTAVAALGRLGPTPARSGPVPAGTAGAAGGPWRSRPLDEVCRAFTADLPVDGVSVSVMTGTTVREMVGVSGPLAEAIEEQQYTLGVGPCFDAYARPGPVLVADVRDPAETRWQAFSAGLGPTPVRAVFAFPLHLGAVLVGAADAYRTVPGLPTTEELRRLLRAVDLLVLALAGARGPRPAHEPRPGDGIGEWEDFLHALPRERMRVHQATGMVMGQLGGTPEQALARLRAHAFSHDRTITAVADDVVARRLRLAPDLEVDG